ncbi:MAG: peroxiredoxin family protein [Candidatus Methanomethylophilaceae archaeon]|jgi:peroxiredoxin Q/BCP
MNSLNIEDAAPDFSIPSTNGGTFILSERVKKGSVLLYFYVTNYGHTCTDYMALMNERKTELDGLNVSLVHINPESIENHREWMKHTDAQFEHLSDRDQTISKMYGAIITRARSEKLIGYTNREFFLIGEDMRIKYIWRAYWPTDVVPMSELITNIKKALPQD